MIVGYRLIRDADSVVVQEWGGVYGVTPDIPNPLRLSNGDHVHVPSVGVSYRGYTLSAWEMEKPVQTVFDGAEFLARITNDEYALILDCADVQLKRWLDIFRLRGEIDVTGNTALAAKQYLVGAGLLSPQRADEVFAAK